VYVWAPEEEGQFQPGRCSRWWLHKSLEALDRDLRALGSRLLCFRGADSRAQLARLAVDLGAQAVLFNHLYDPISMVGGPCVCVGKGGGAAGACRHKSCASTMLHGAVARGGKAENRCPSAVAAVVHRCCHACPLLLSQPSPSKRSFILPDSCCARWQVRDNEVKAGLAAAGVFCQSFNADILREPWDVLDARGQPFTNYEAFWTAHCALPLPPPAPLPMPGALPPLPAGVEAEAGALSLAQLGIMSPEEEMSNAQLEYHWQPGSAGAHRVLAEFVGSGRLRRFDRDRARTDRASTSRLSPHIHYGEISVRHIHCVARQQEVEWACAGEGGTAVNDFLRQLGYREYSRYLSFHFPFTHERSLLEHLRAVPWRFDQHLFKAWRQGRTGYPLVDAAMREVWSTGWMHNRMRVVAASFMVKNLLLPWQWGLKHYWDALLDADLECDALGWQYVAGCMADAHDFSTLIDQRSEARRFDPDGHYVRRWLPVLARLPARHIHEPWLAPQEVLEDAGGRAAGGWNALWLSPRRKTTRSLSMCSARLWPACLLGPAPSPRPSFPALCVT
jgi:cryptochrome 1